MATFTRHCLRALATYVHFHTDWRKQKKLVTLDSCQHWCATRIPSTTNIDYLVYSAYIWKWMKKPPIKYTKEVWVKVAKIKYLDHGAVCMNF